MTAEFSGETFRLRSGHADHALLVRRQAGAGAPVLYVHGATFPSALSVAYRFAGRSWMDDLAARGFDAWAFDFAGFGGSDRYDEMDGDETPAGRAADAAAQIARVADHIVGRTGHARVSIIAHSWGTMPSGLFAAANPERIDRLCLFGPVAQRDGIAGPPPMGRTRTVSVAQQLARFIEDVPPGHASVLIEPTLADWGPAYLATDPQSGRRTPPAVKIPAGPAADIHAAWSGKLAWQPSQLRCPVLIVRGAWDSVSSDADAQWLLSRIQGPVKRDAKIAEGTHLMHLEHAREALFAATGAFLLDKDF